MTLTACRSLFAGALRPSGNLSVREPESAAPGTYARKWRAAATVAAIAGAKSFNIGVKTPAHRPYSPHGRVELILEPIPSGAHTHGCLERTPLSPVKNKTAEDFRKGIREKQMEKRAQEYNRAIRGTVRPRNPRESSRFPRHLIQESAARVTSCQAGNSSAHRLNGSVSAPILLTTDHGGTAEVMVLPDSSVPLAPGSPEGRRECRSVAELIKSVEADEATAEIHGASSDDDETEPPPPTAATAAATVTHQRRRVLPPGDTARRRPKPNAFETRDRHVTFKIEEPKRTVGARAAEEFGATQRGAHAKLEAALEERERHRETVFALRHASKALDGLVLSRHTHPEMARGTAGLPLPLTPSIVEAPGSEAPGSEAPGSEAPDNRAAGRAPAARRLAKPSVAEIMRTPASRKLPPSASSARASSSSLSSGQASATVRFKALDEEQPESEATISEQPQMTTSESRTLALDLATEAATTAVAALESADAEVARRAIDPWAAPEAAVLAAEAAAADAEAAWETAVHTVVGTKQGSTEATPESTALGFPLTTFNGSLVTPGRLRPSKSDSSIASREETTSCSTRGASAAAPPRLMSSRLLRSTCGSSKGSVGLAAVARHIAARAAVGPSPTMDGEHAVPSWDDPNRETLHVPAAGSEAAPDPERLRLSNGQVPTPGRMRATRSDGSLPRHRRVFDGPGTNSSTKPSGYGLHNKDGSAHANKGRCRSACASAAYSAPGATRGKAVAGSLWHEAVDAVNASDGGRLHLWQALQHKAKHREGSEGARWLAKAPNESAELCAVLFDELRGLFDASPPLPIGYQLVEQLFIACSGHMINREGGRELLLPLFQVCSEHACLTPEELRLLMNKHCFPEGMQAKRRWNNLSLASRLAKPSGGSERGSRNSTEPTNGSVMASRLSPSFDYEVATSPTQIVTPAPSAFAASDSQTSSIPDGSGASIFSSSSLSRTPGGSGSGGIRAVSMIRQLAESTPFANLKGIKADDFRSPTDTNTVTNTTSSEASMRSSDMDSSGSGATKVGGSLASRKARSRYLESGYLSRGSTASRRSGGSSSSSSGASGTTSGASSRTRASAACTSTSTTHASSQTTKSRVTFESVGSAGGDPRQAQRDWLTRQMQQADTMEDSATAASPSAAELPAPRPQMLTRRSSSKIVPGLVVAARRGEPSFHPQVSFGSAQPKDLACHHGLKATGGGQTPGTDVAAGPNKLRPPGAPSELEVVGTTHKGGRPERPFSAGRPFAAAFGATMRTINMDDALD